MRCFSKRGGIAALLVTSAASLSLGPTAVQAATIEGPLTAVTGIDFLTFTASSGAHYLVNVSFDTGVAFSAAYGDGGFLFDTAPATANDAVNAVRAVLQAASATALVGGADSFIVPYALGAEAATGVVGGEETSPLEWANLGVASADVSGSSTQAWAVFSPGTPPVPAPAAAWLMLSGLGALAAWARKRSAVTARTG